MYSRIKGHLLWVATATAATPRLALAQVSDLNDFIQLVSQVINAILPILIGLGIMYLLWGILRYIRAGDNPDERNESRAFMLNGIIALFVMVSVWGLVNILVNTFSLNNDVADIPTLPSLPTLP